MMCSLNEIGIIPAITSDIKSRSEVNPFTKDGKLPIFVAPMTSVINDDNFPVFNDRITAIHPRTENLCVNFADEWQAYSLQQFKELFVDDSVNSAPLCNPNDLNSPARYKALIDVANGHMKCIYEYVSKAKEKYGQNLEVMIGNIANPTTYRECCKAGVDYVRVGIGGGSACTTGVQTGIHASMVWLLNEIGKLKDTMSEVETFKDEDKKLYHKVISTWGASGFRTKIIVDGGIDTIDKAIKCLALGADYVMMGKLFAQCEEACGERGLANPNMRKYYGMASEQGQKDISGGVTKNPEGIETWVPIKYTLEQFISKFEAALVSCMSYCGTSNLDEFIGKVIWLPMTLEEFKSYYK